MKVLSVSSMPSSLPSFVIIWMIIFSIILKVNHLNHRFSITQDLIQNTVYRLNIPELEFSFICYYKQ
jgi:hypothetical protein